MLRLLIILVLIGDVLLAIGLFRGEERGASAVVVQELDTSIKYPAELREIEVHLEGAEPTVLSVLLAICQQSGWSLIEHTEALDPRRALSELRLPRFVDGMIAQEVFELILHVLTTCSPRA